MEYRIIVLYRSRLGFSDFDRVCWSSNYLLRFWVIQSAVPCSCLLDLNWDLHLPLGTHISVDMVITMFFYNRQTRKQLIIIVLYHQSFIVFINNKLVINTQMTLNLIFNSYSVLQCCSYIIYKIIIFASFAFISFQVYAMNFVLYYWKRSIVPNLYMSLNTCVYFRDLSC